MYECKAERHDQIITNQKEALNDLRQQIKQLTSKSKEAAHVQQQKQQQILAEVRAKSAFADIEPYTQSFPKQTKEPMRHKEEHVSQEFKANVSHNENEERVNK